MKKRYEKTVRLGNNMRADVNYLPRWTKGLMPTKKSKRGTTTIGVNKKTAVELVFALNSYIFDPDAKKLLYITTFLRDKESKKGITLTVTTRKKILDK